MPNDEVERIIEIIKKAEMTISFFNNVNITKGAKNEQ